MKITKGTPQAMSFLTELKESGDLVDVYSEDFFDRQPTYEDDPSAPFSKGGFEMIEETESDLEAEAKPKNHLLFIFVDEYKKENREKLKTIYPPVQKFFEQYHLPDFLLLNLYTKQMLCVGFGRKNRLFIMDAETGNPINAFNLNGVADDSRYMDQFLEHDVYESVSDFIHALYDLGITMYEYDSLPGNEELVEWSLDEENTKDGLHYIEGEEEGYTTDQINLLLEKYRKYQADEDEAMKMIRVFFPKCERGELNTGDYPF